MSQDISFCPMCAGRLDSGDEDDHFLCEDCEVQFLIQIVSESDDDDDDA